MPPPLTLRLIASALLLQACATKVPSASDPKDDSPLVVGGWALPLSQKSGKVERQGNRQTIVFSIDQYEDSSFDRSGYYDGGGSFAHAYGGDGEGGFTYTFSAGPQQPSSIEIKARLSAESQSIGKPQETSDVVLSINGVALEKKTVRADDGKGEIYTWTLRDPKKIAALRLDSEQESTLALEVKGRNKNGLCIYGRSLDGSPGASPLSISMELPTSAQHR